MADAPTLSPEVSRSVTAVARTLVAAARSWALYPAGHPALRSALDRLQGAVSAGSAGQVFAFGVTPDTLLVAGIAVDARDGAVAEAARWLHDRDIVQLTFASEVTVPVLERLLAVLSEDTRLVRDRGGPAKVWAEDGDRAITVQQIDYTDVLADRDVTNPIRCKDDLWRSLVRGILNRARPTDEAAQARLLSIAGDVTAIGELTTDVIAPHHALDGSPMLTSQAAAVVAAYHHLMGIVDVLSPDRRQEVMQNLAAATATLNPHLVLQMFTRPGADATAPGADGAAGSVVSGLMAAMDDSRVAQLLATTLAIEGQASDRLATVFNTIATDDDRKTRVLALTRRLLSETDFGRRDAFQNLWSSMEALLLTYNERPFVSAAYRASLDQAAGRANQMAAEVPEEFGEMLETLGQDNVRRLSVRLLIDLLHLEKDAARAPELARDVAALAEDLLLAGDYESTLAVVTALRDQASDSAAVARESSRLALDTVVGTAAFVETSDALGEMTAAEAALFADICGRIGAASTDALKAHLDADPPTQGLTRASAMIRQYGAGAVGRLASVAGSSRWAAQRNVAELLGDIGAPEGVPLLQALLRGHEPRVTAAAVRALAQIKDPAAGRAVHTVLRAATGEQRRAVIQALVEQRDARVVPLLVRILEESDPFNADHPIVIDALAALTEVGDDQAIPALAIMMRRTKFLARKKSRALKTQSLAALRGIRTPAAAQAIAEAAANGDRMLRKLARTGPGA